mgnify:CR=1 FL=1
MYFSLLPDLQFSDKRVKYRYTENDFTLAKNIFRTIEIDNSAYSTNLFIETQVKDNVRPDQLAFQLYGKSDYDWIILLTNKIKNFYNDWPLNQQAFETYVTNKYDNIDGVHHYETVEITNSLGEIVQPAGLIVYYNPSEYKQLSVVLRDGTFINPPLKVTDIYHVTSSISSTILLRTGFYTFNISAGPVFSLTYLDSYSPEVHKTLSADQLLTAVSNYDYELALNEKKRTIQILRPEYVTRFVKLFKAAVAYSPNEQLASETIKKTLRF